MQKLKQYQNEHKSLQEKTQYMLDRSQPREVVTAQFVEPVAPMGS